MKLGSLPVLFPHNNNTYSAACSCCVFKIKWKENYKNINLTSQALAFWDGINQFSYLSHVQSNFHISTPTLSIYHLSPKHRHWYQFSLLRSINIYQQSPIWLVQLTHQFIFQGFFHQSTLFGQLKLHLQTILHILQFTRTPICIIWLVHIFNFTTSFIITFLSYWKSFLQHLQWCCSTTIAMDTSCSHAHHSFNQPHESRSASRTSTMFWWHWKIVKRSSRDWTEVKRMAGINDCGDGGSDGINGGGVFLRHLLFL